MEYLNYENFTELVKDLIRDRLLLYEEASCYGCDLAYVLFESENSDGTLTYNTYYSKEIIKKYFDDFGELYDEFLKTYGTGNEFDIFNEAEKFVVAMVIFKADQMLSEVDLVRENWNELIDLNEENIERINGGIKCQD